MADVTETEIDIAVAQLTEVQRDVLKCHYSASGPRSGFFEVSWDIKEGTARSLERKQLVDKWPGRADRYQLTDLGLAVVLKLNEVSCTDCGKATHEHEAACVHCGALKEWADD